VSHHYAGDIDRKIAVAELVELKQIGVNLADQACQKFGGFGEVLRSFVHPLQAESRGTVFEAVKVIHPGSLIGERDLAESDERDSHAARNQSRNQFASVGPGAGQGIGCDQNVQEVLRELRDAAVGAGSGAALPHFSAESG
jgi:hypothetical protein